MLMLLGTFHFANPGKDLIKNNVIDVLSESSQLYLQALAQRLARFQPTAIALEYGQERDPEINERYLQYSAGKHPLAASEIEQIGFRVAALVKLKRVHGFDETNVPW